MKRYKFSKTYIAAFMYRFAFLLFVPFLQVFLFAGRGAQKLFTLYSADLLVAVFLLSVAVIRYKSNHLTIKGKTLTMHQGAVIKTSANSFFDFKGSILSTEGFFLRLARGSRLRIFAGTAYSTAYLRGTDKTKLFKSIINDSEKIRFSSGILRSLLMSLSFSNALTGLLAAVPVIRRVSAVLGARQTALILEGASLQGLLSFTGLPPTLSKISSLLFLCWLVGFFTEFFREYGLKFSVYSFHFKVSKGLITKTQALFGKGAVKALVFRQSLMMFIFGLYSAEVKLNIKPRRKIHLISAATRTRCSDLEDVIYGEKGERCLYLAPPKTSLWGYTYLPLLCLALASAGLIVFSQNLIAKAVLGVSTGIFAVWFLFRTVALYRSSLSFWKDILEVKYFSGMNFTRCIFKLSDVNGFEVTQSIFQRISGKCNLIIKISNTSAIRVKIKHLRLKDLEKHKKAGSP